MSRHADPHAKEALVAAARAEFARRGLRGARIEDITAACGLSKGAFYLHFESKEGLFGALVQAFVGEMGGAAGIRVSESMEFFEREGSLVSADFRKSSPRLQRWNELELAMDVRSLELMWRYRDVLDVLISGCQGTPFEKTVWELVDAEQGRIAENHRQFQCSGCLRSDVAPELFGAMVVGTYLLVGKQMARAAEKPDLASMARSLQTLIHEGSLPRDLAPLRRDQRPRAGSPKQPKSRVVKSSRKQLRTNASARSSR